MAEEPRSDRKDRDVLVAEARFEQLGVAMSVKQTDKGRTRPPDWLVARVKGEFFEMPGLRLTCEQACRLWQVDVSTCKKLLDHLVREGSLCSTNSGFYVASETTRRRR